jgi:cytochrome c oxidase subunit 2
VNPALDQHALVPAGPQAARIAELYWFYGSVMAVVCILVWAFVLVALFRRRVRLDAPPSPQLDEDELRDADPAQPVRELSAAHEQVRLRWVIGATGVTVVTLFVLLYQSIAAGSLLGDEAPQGALRIEVTGHRWWWGVRYLDDDPSKIVVTANEIHIPVKRPVQLVLASSDVIHSFWVPNVHGKRDLVPGRTTTLVLQVDRPGVYRGQCAEFCGHAHAQMALLLVVEPAERFEAWRSAQRAPAPTPTTAEQQRGQEVFMQGPCMLCHAISGTAAQASLGPDLSHVASRRTLAAGMLPNNRGNLAGWIVNAQHLKPATPMPNISLESADLHALIAYLESLE